MERLFYNCTFALGLVLALFAIEGIHHLKMAFIAILGAITALVLVRPELGEILFEVEWPVLFFFASLFVIVGGVDAAGVLQLFGKRLSDVSSNLLTLSLVILCLSALLSAFIDNIPYTATPIPIIEHLGATGINMNPLWWALAMGIALGGNGTPIGSSAGVVAIGLADKTPYPITFKMWIRSAGIVSLLLTTTLATLFIMVAFSWFS